ncbi:hypothetical protein [Micromonospora sp. DT229]|uniref:hypothetical protein n=1 Tax=Micromonospora sp. DT229 TaxID=3393430 RepID=UPI003CF642C4
MPMHPDDRHQQDPTRIWPYDRRASRLLGQSRHRSRRTGRLSWEALNRSSVGGSACHLNTH